MNEPWWIAVIISLCWAANRTLELILNYRIKMRKLKLKEKQEK